MAKSFRASTVIGIGLFYLCRPQIIKCDIAYLKNKTKKMQLLIIKVNAKINHVKPILLIC